MRNTHHLYIIPDIKSQLEYFFILFIIFLHQGFFGTPKYNRLLNHVLFFGFVFVYVFIFADSTFMKSSGEKVRSEFLRSVHVNILYLVVRHHHEYITLFILS